MGRRAICAGQCGIVHTYSNFVYSVDPSSSRSFPLCLWLISGCVGYLGWSSFEHHCSIILGYYWGLTGVVLGVFISLFLMIFLWKTYFALKWGIGIKMLDYFRYYIRHLIVLGIVTGSLLKLFSLFPTVDLSWGNFIFYSMVKVSLFFILMFLCLYASCNGMKQFVKRLYKIWF